MEREWPWRMTATFLMTQRTCRRVLRTGRPELPISLIVCIKKTLRWRDTGWVEILLLLSHLFSVAVYSWRTFVEGTTIFHLSWRCSNYSLEGVNLCRCVNRYHCVCIRLFCPLLTHNDFFLSLRLRRRKSSRLRPRHLLQEKNLLKHELLPVSPIKHVMSCPRVMITDFNMK